MFGTVNDGNVGYAILLVKYLTLNMQGVGVVVYGSGFFCLVLLVVVGRVADAVDMVLLVLMRD